MHRSRSTLASLLLLVLLALALGGCDLFPKTGTEWAIAGGIFGAILIAIVVMAWKNSKGPPKS